MYASTIIFLIGENRCDMIPKMDNAPEVRTFEVPLTCRYLLHVPADLPPDPLVFLALHGYGSNPEVMLRLTLGLLGSGHLIASLQAPFQHYGGDRPGSSSAIGYNWGVRNHHEEAIRLHHTIVRRVLAELSERFGATPRRTILLGFSQPVGLNYRFIGTHPGEAGGIVGLCGGVPRDWSEDKYQHVAAPVLHISRDQDEFFPLDTVKQFPQRLAAHAGDVEFRILPGAHRFPSKAAPIVHQWLESRFGVRLATIGNP